MGDWEESQMGRRVERQPPPNSSKLAGTSHPSPAPPRPPTTPAAPARRPGTQGGTHCATHVCDSGNNARCRCKQDARSIPTSTTRGIVEPDSQDNLKMARFSGGTYSKPAPRVKMIPAEQITYSPLSSRTVSLAQNPMPSASCLPRKRLETAESRDSCAGGHISSSVTTCISLKNLESSKCKSSQPTSTNLNTDGTRRNLDKMVSTQAHARSSSSSILHSQAHNSEEVSARLPKEVVTNPMPPSPKTIGAPHSSDNPQGVCKPKSGKLCSRDNNLSTTSTTVPGLQVPIVELALLSPTFVLSERPIEVCHDRRTDAPVTQEPNAKPVLLTPIPVHCESSMECQKVPPKHIPQSIASAQYGTMSQERNAGASIIHGESSESHHDMDLLETSAPLILPMKLHKRHYQSETNWKGNFHVTGGLVHTCDELEAHFPSNVDVGVYESSNQMPEILNLELLAPPMPDSEDIGLWFVSSHERPHRSFDHLLEKVGTHTGLFTKIGDIELAVFSSKLLTTQDQRNNGKFYFWGVLGKRIRKKPCQPNNYRVNDCMAVLGTPDSNLASSSSVPAASFLNGCCHHASAQALVSSRSQRQKRTIKPNSKYQGGDWLV